MATRTATAAERAPEGEDDPPAREPRSHGLWLPAWAPRSARTIMELGSTDSITICRAVLDGPDQPPGGIYCGDAVKVGCSYCEAHAARFHNVVAPVKRSQHWR